MSNHASMRSSADARSYSAQAGKYEDGDVIVGENERVVCVERLQTQTQEQPVVVYEEHLQERTANVTKPVTRTTVTERPVITPIRKTIQIVREVPVERIVEKPYKRKVYIERIIEQVVEVFKDVPVERPVERIVEVVKEVPVEKIVERIQVKEIPVVETEERIKEIVREVPVEVVKEVPVYIKVDPAEWDSRHSLRASTSTLVGVSSYSPQSTRRSPPRQPSPIRKQMQRASFTGDIVNSTQTLSLRSSTQSITPMTSYAASKIKAGVGIILEREPDGEIYVRKLMPGSPAYLEGSIRVDDKLLCIDDLNVQGNYLDHIFDMINGIEGSPIKLTLARGSEIYSISLTRGQVRN